MPPPNYVVQASVVDVRTDTPRASDALLVDTNVWYWQTYTKCSIGPKAAHPNQLSSYPSYMSKALAHGTRICRCGVSLGELAHLIESTERDILIAASGTQLTAKEFRHLPGARNKVVGEICTAWAQVETMSDLIEVRLDAPTIAEATRRLSEAPTDAYDAVMLTASKLHGIDSILTDDGDFCGVSGITVFTANHRVIQAAAKQGRLLQRN